MNDEEWLFHNDTREKKNIAHSARNKRTHNGKRGGVKFPSDYMTQKEIKKMSGEAKTYRLNEPMSWKEFKGMPDDIKVMYVKLLREKYRVSDTKIAHMMGATQATAQREFLRLGVTLGKGVRQKNFDSEGWTAWCNGLKGFATETPVAAEEPIPEYPEITDEETVFVEPEEPVVCRAIPNTGNMVFKGKTEEILKTVAALLGGANVHISITWDVMCE